MNSLEVNLETRGTDAESAIRGDKYSADLLKDDVTVENIPNLVDDNSFGWGNIYFPAIYGLFNLISGMLNRITGMLTIPIPANRSKIEKNNTQKTVYQFQDRPPVSDVEEQIRRVQFDASLPVDSAVQFFSQRDCAKNNAEANRDIALAERAQCEPRGGDAEAPAMSLPTLVDPAETCHAKMAKIQDLLAGKGPSSGRIKRVSRYRPKKIFIDPKFVQDKTVDSFVPEQVGRLHKVFTPGFVNPGVITRSDLVTVETLPRVKLENNLHGQNKTIGAIQSSNLKQSGFECNKVEVNINKNSVAAQQPKVGIANEHSPTTNINSSKDEAECISGMAAVTEAATAVSSLAQNKHGVRDETKVTNEKSRDLHADAMARDHNATPGSAPESKREIITSCEDKLSRLKQLLSERKKCRIADKNADSPDAPFNNIEEELQSSSDTSVIDHRTTNTDCPKTKIKPKNLKQFEDDTSAESETDTIDGSPKITVTPPDSNGFEEMIKEKNSRLPSDTSEDSFIVFEEDDRPKDNGFVSDDPAPGCSSGSEYDSDVESNLASVGRFSRTLADLTDESLYLDGDGWGGVDESEPSDDEDEPEPVSTGLLITEEKKRRRKDRPEKKVRFSTAPPQVRVLRVWSFAARQARVGSWRQAAADAERFRRRIADVDMAISWVLKPQHRNRVKFQRFMPWWHAERRREEEEKRRAAEERRREEETRKREEEERRKEEEMIEEEVRKELEREKKNKKKITTHQFARNYAIYLNKMKQQKKSGSQISLNEETSDEKSISRNEDTESKNVEALRNLSNDINENLNKNFNGDVTDADLKVKNTDVSTNVNNEDILVTKRNMDDISALNLNNNNDTKIKVNISNIKENNEHVSNIHINTSEINGVNTIYKDNEKDVDLNVQMKIDLNVPKQLANGII